MVLYAYRSWWRLCGKDGDGWVGSNPHWFIKGYHSVAKVSRLKIGYDVSEAIICLNNGTKDALDRILPFLEKLDNESDTTLNKRFEEVSRVFTFFGYKELGNWAYLFRRIGNGLACNYIMQIVESFTKLLGVMIKDVIEAQTIQECRTHIAEVLDFVEDLPYSLEHRFRRLGIYAIPIKTTEWKQIWDNESIGAAIAAPINVLGRKHLWQNHSPKKKFIAALLAHFA